MKKFIYTILLALAAGFTACDEHEVPVDWSDKDGNIYCTDGSIVPLAQLASSSKTPAGVVVKVGNDTDDFQASVIALHDVGSYAYADTLYNISNVATDTEAFNGKSNTAALLVEYTSEPRLNPSAAIMASSFNASGITGWHLPSVAELKAANNAVVQSALQQVGKPFDNDWYITSTVDGTSGLTAVNYNYCVSMTEGRVVSSIKTEGHRVRPFLLVK